MRKVAALAVGLALLAGCGGSDAKKAQRETVNAYITQVDAAVAALVGEREQIDSVLARFSLARPSPAYARRLRAVEAQVRGVSRRVRALRPPPAAARLHADLLALLGLEATTASHLASSAELVPRLAAALAPVSPAGATLARDLKAAKTWAADSEAYGHYRDALMPVVTALRALDPPPELQPTVAAQIRQVRRRAELSDSVAAAFAKRDVEAVNAGLRGFAALASQGEADRTYRAQVAMTKAYNARLDRIDALAVQIARERQKLVAALG